MTEAQRDIVLAVDDSPETLGFLTTALETAGITVLVATSGAAALSVADRVTPDIILMDAIMPGLSGFETCQQIKSKPHLQHVPVIFMTGLSETEHVVNALDSGGVDFLTKPINIDELQARIRVHLANARSVQSARIALDAAGRHLIAIARDGTIRWSTPQTHQVLSTTGNGDKLLQDIGAELGSWLAADAGKPSGQSDPFELSPGNGLTLQMQYLGAIGADEFLFRMTTSDHPNQDEVLRQHFGLTAREADVLLWIAKGKANRDIGEILGLSPRTVNKHLEQIYQKLGVENRASAAVRAAHVLHEL
ncbi:DNA-binding response regulator [Roseibium polysiphoniae]|uniref:Response regulator n=1 Tax=Roseibium polysiphoniae TaxID=2571221 RepID=A0A944CGM8_9HYPH|nr:DNA-binding response regulator [Roseibium polysiphoniae]MBD8877426.1 response regulator [Roseibium polysiphoniae]MBS8261886.1 DNA-binding response regulator [Roseibium polysiphoniae]